MFSKTTPRRTRLRKRSRSGRLRAILSLGMVLGLGAVSTMASWSDSTTIQGGTFTAGTLDIKVGNPAIDNNPTEFTTHFAMSNMVPGSTKDAILKVSNGGSTPFDFAGTAPAADSGNGADQLRAVLTIAAYATNDGNLCTGAPISSGDTAATFTLPLSSLAPGAIQELCFRATLPTTASTALQGKSSVITLTLEATQKP